MDESHATMAAEIVRLRVQLAVMRTALEGLLEEVDVDYSSPRAEQKKLVVLEVYGALAHGAGEAEARVLEAAERIFDNPCARAALGGGNILIMAVEAMRKERV